MKLGAGAVAPLVAALAWTAVILVTREPGQDHTTLLLGIGLMLSATVAMVGMIVVQARWAHRLGWLVLLATGVVAVRTETSPWWYTALAISALSAIALVLSASQVRRLPAATGPPERAVLVTLLLLGVPFMVGISVEAPVWAALSIGLSAPAVALLYSRVIIGGLLLVRLGWPLLTLVASVFVPSPAWMVPVSLAIAVAILAHDPLVKTAFHPVRETGSTFPIPPELTPKDILDAARLDDRGRPR